MSTPHVLECPACQMVDRADGVEDGNLYPVMAGRVKNERRIIRAVRKAQDQAADRVTGFAGSMAFVYIHALWFGAWVLINLGLHVAGLPKFDPYPFGLLTMIVSLEAIFLATLVMISQNRQAHRSDVRSEIDFENNLRAELWSIHVGYALGIDAEHVEAMVRQTMDGYMREVGIELTSKPVDTNPGTARPAS
jgi:uncharacterized membrane protein